jgi:hypothetical protein
VPDLKNKACADDQGEAFAHSGDVFAIAPSFPVRVTRATSVFYSGHGVIFPRQHQFHLCGRNLGPRSHSIVVGSEAREDDVVGYAANSLFPV